ncbi:MAG: T9SS type A sorting domain-containing protein [Melioribacteraceae bacterium]|nr:T9SS type A sorting domain-containing protein [Melioribacteraceae bacterium]MCF8394186.1 T9SS type A sorting domain-containing protein [Melioribacteraceae bacterium]MCF8419906.1 T9SS type A sorting domain-containing protein [Melioribacteraceae bacterium]
MKKLFSICLTLLLFTAITINAQDAFIKVDGISPGEIVWGEIDTSVYQTPSTGLANVGIGDIVYLFAMPDTGTTFVWTLTGPDGSSATLDNTDQQMTALKTDMVGAFTVGLTVDGVAAEDVVINSGTYKGYNNCMTCHSPVYGEYENTGHADMFTLAIDGLKSSHYGESCIECHTVGYNTDPDADNNGFDDVAEDVAWTFPDSLVDGNWDDIVLNYDPLQYFANIQCENCHGPGSEHVAGFGAPDIMSVTLDEAVCGRCHEDASHHVKNTEWKLSRHATGGSFARGTSGSCAPCHSGEGYIATHDATTQFGHPETGTSNVSCQVCHDPHHNPEGEGTMQLRTFENVVLPNGYEIAFGGSGKLCMQCHHGRRNVEEYVEEYHSHYGPHHSNQADLLAGTNAITFGRYIPSSTHRDALEDGCVSCHMYETPAEGPAMHKLGAHTFSIWTEVDGVRYDNTEACARCHGELESFEEFPARHDYDEDGTIETAMAEIEGLLHELGLLLPPYDDPAVDVSADYSKLELKAAFNYLFVEEDQSMGMHNFQYAVGLLKTSIEAMNYGVLSEGEILGIADVPNDQGRQVEIAWTRFGGDGVSDDPLSTYVVLRKSMLTAPEDVVVYDSFQKVPQDVEVDETFGVNDGLWTVVATVPAFQYLEYSAVVPTLGDSTADGMFYSHFKVLGVTEGMATAETAVDSGYSVDNLHPAPPVGLIAEVGDATINLAWQESMDVDFKYFAIYRGTTENFELTTPIATTTGLDYSDADVSFDVRYYYKVTATDFSGNEGEASEEVNAMIVGLGIDEGIPTDYSLYQNYPNPFNPTTTIKFAVPEAANVKLIVYNAVGKEVATLVNKTLDVGYYEYQWNASSTASGVYFYKIMTDNFTSVKKMLLIK